MLRFGTLGGLAIAGFAGAAVLAGSATAEEVSPLPVAADSPGSVPVPPPASVGDLVRTTVREATSDAVAATHQVVGTANTAAAVAGTVGEAVTALAEPVLETTTRTVRSVTDTGSALVAPAVQTVSEVAAPLTVTESAAQRTVGWVTVTVTSVISPKTPAATPFVPAMPDIAPVAAPEPAADVPVPTADFAAAAVGVTDAAPLSPVPAADHALPRLTTPATPSPLSPIVPIAPAMLPGSAPSSGTSAAQGGSSTSAAIFDGGPIGSRFTTGEPVSDQHLPLRMRADDPSVSPD
ncbi:hypothetical protein [Amycolatopsis sp. NPDC102389]|uniref:hypothetical protein n=1 Tax=Amycolatopsis sp. NPDC102389 TaxID=3363941 RepID=UPI00380D52ED